MEHPDQETFPLVNKAEYLECILQQGELLYMPASIPMSPINHFCTDLFQSSQNGGTISAHCLLALVSVSGFE